MIVQGMHVINDCLVLEVYMSRLARYYPKSFSLDDETLHVVYIGSELDPEPFYSAVDLERFLGISNPSASASRRLDVVTSRIEAYLVAHPELRDQAQNELGAVTLLNSVKPARIAASDTIYKVLAVNTSSRANARSVIYYNQAVVFFVISRSSSDVANDVQHFINGTILPTIKRTGTYIGVRKDGIALRVDLTDAIKERIDAREYDEGAYATITDLVYFIRYGVHTAELRTMVGADTNENIRERLTQDELQALSTLERDLTALVHIGYTIDDMAKTEKLIARYRCNFKRPIVV